jgi:hypothetical protein
MGFSGTTIEFSGLNRIDEIAAQKSPRYRDLTKRHSYLYIVHMKYVTASEARKKWFQLLDEAVNGEIIAIQRDDKRLILKADKRKARIPNYSGLIHFPDADGVDTWSWRWKGPGRLVSKRKRTSHK